ncbi:MAG: hypothetical protein RLZZ461_903, partial [Planctomycetota bacterium]
MKVDRLMIEGFGPFSGRQEIDFTDLNQAGLFLLAGPTGIGKTSILDAICFALFGETTGEGQGSGHPDGREGRELRSTDAAANQRTAVTLDFAVGGQRYRIERNPDYVRPKQRGEGVTREAAKVVLGRLIDGRSGDAQEDWEPIADGARGTKDQVKEIVGFDADQFRRVMIVPQGRFREVLISSPQSRED